MRYLWMIFLFTTFLSCNKNETPKPDTSGLFIKFFGGALHDEGFSVAESGDGGFYIVGNTLLPNRLDTCVLVVKVNSNGNKVWEQEYDLGDSFNEIGRDIAVGSDGEVVVAGYKENEAGFFDFLLLEIDPSDPSDFIFQVFGDSLIDEKAYNLVEAPDGTYIVYGGKASGTESAPTADMFLLKTDLTDTIWVRQIGVADRQDEIGKLYITGSNQLVWCGTAHRNDGTDMRMILADDFGNLMWDYGFEDNDFLNQYSYDLELLSDGYLLAGSKNRSNTSSSKDIYLVRTDLNGLKTDQNTNQIILSETASQEAYSIISDGSGNFVLTGYAASDKGDKDVYVVKLDANGNILKSGRFGGEGEDVGRKIIKTTSGYLIIGTIYAGNNFMIGVYKVNEELELVE